jgi:4-carboxymuconolactone decarboxylase
MPRIELLNDKALVPEEQHAEFDAIVEVLHRVGGPFAILLRSPGLAEKVMNAGAQVRLGSTLESKERELSILAVAREKDGAYEWASHVGTARNGGLSEETIEAVRHNVSDISGLPDDDRDIVTYVRQLLRTNKVEQGLFDSLKERKGERWLVELTATIGQYQYISAINNAFELQPAPDADQLPV